jgi:anti-sigma28 factor (negative regulator of flagellin synthesis)
MNINNVGSSSPIQKVVTNPVQKSIPTDAPKNLPATDRLQLSGASHLLAALKTNDVRTDKVASIRAQIESGTYETDEKLDGAADKLIDELNK